MQKVTVTLGRQSQTQIDRYAHINRSARTARSIVFNDVHFSADEFFCHITRRPSRGTRRRPYKLFKKRSVSRTIAIFFGNRVINVWNDLPA